jgi:hypothetical protein
LLRAARCVLRAACSVSHALMLPASADRRFRRFLSTLNRHDLGLRGSIWQYLAVFGSIWQYLATLVT